MQARPRRVCAHISYVQGRPGLLHYYLFILFLFSSCFHNQSKPYENECSCALFQCVPSGRKGFFKKPWGRLPKRWKDLTLRSPETHNSLPVIDPSHFLFCNHFYCRFEKLNEVGHKSLVGLSCSTSLVHGKWSKLRKESSYRAFWSIAPLWEANSA